MKKATILLVIVALAVTACARIPSERSVVARQFYYGVILENISTSKVLHGEQLLHPFDVTLQDLHSLMSGLVYTEDGTNNIPVFQCDEIDRLVPVLVNALSHATKSQYVRFVSFSQRKSIFFKKSYKSEGVLFVSDDKRLNLAFNYINSKRASSETTAMYHKYSPLDSLEIETTTTPIAVTGVGMKLHHLADGTVSPMWLRVDLSSIEPEPMVSVPDLEGDDTVLKDPEVSVPVVIVKNKVLKVREEQHSHIKQQLKFLKNLFDDGLISQEEYRSKKSKFLDKIN